MSKPNIAVDSIPDPDERINNSILNAFLKAMTHQSKVTTETLQNLDKKIDNLSHSNKRPNENSSDNKKGNNVIRTKKVCLRPSPVAPARTGPSSSSSSSLIDKPGTNVVQQGCDFLRSSQIQDQMFVDPLAEPISDVDFDDGESVENNNDCVDNVINDHDGSYEDDVEPRDSVSVVSSHNGFNPASKDGQQVQDDEEELDIPIIGAEVCHTWVPPVKALKWFEKVADNELSEAQVTDIMATFIPPAEISSHFEPPLVPAALWNSMKSQNNSFTLFQQRSIFKSQKLICSALMPLLSVLESLGPGNPNQKTLASAIQLICSSNLNLSRFRRSATAKFLKSDIRKPLLTKPVTHLHLFGSSFDESAEQAVKTVSSSSKVLISQPSTSSQKQAGPARSQRSSSSGPHISSNSASTSSSTPSHSRSRFFRYRGRGGQARRSRQGRR